MHKTRGTVPLQGLVVVVEDRVFGARDVDAQARVVVDIDGQEGFRGILVNHSPVEGGDEGAVFAVAGHVAHEIVEIVVPVLVRTEIGLDAGPVDGQDLVAVVLEDGPASGGKSLQVSRAHQRNGRRPINARLGQVKFHVTLADDLHGFFRLLGEKRLDNLLIGEAFRKDLRRGEDDVVAAVAQFVGDFHIGHQAAVEDQEIIVIVRELLAQVEQVDFGTVVFRKAHQGSAAGLFFGADIVAGWQEAGGMRP